MTESMRDYALRRFSEGADIKTVRAELVSAKPMNVVGWSYLRKIHVEAERRRKIVADVEETLRLLDLALTEARRIGGGPVLLQAIEHAQDNLRRAHLEDK